MSQEQSVQCQDMDHLWKLFGLGSATSEGYHERAEGSGRIFAYGYIGPETGGKKQPGVDITSWQGEEKTLIPATKENVAHALGEMGMTETKWGL